METPIKTTVAGIITKVVKGEELILLTRRSDSMNSFPGKWCLPGGHIDRNEPAEKAIKREIKEETGLRFSGTFFQYFDEIIPRKNIHSTVLVYEGSGSGEVKIDKEEVSDYDWYPLKKAQKMDLAFTHKEIVNAYIKNPRNVVDKEPFLAEYNHLRNEILKHIEIRHKTLHYAIIIFGIFLGLTEIISDKDSYSVLLFYPIIATFLAAHWSHSDLRIYDIAEYIKENIEKVVVGLNWESELRHAKKITLKSKSILEKSILGFFIVSQIIAIGLVILLKIKEDGFFLSGNWEFKTDIDLFLLGIGNIYCIYKTHKYIKTRRKRYST